VKKIKMNGRTGGAQNGVVASAAFSLAGGAALARAGDIRRKRHHRWPRACGRAAVQNRGVSNGVAGNGIGVAAASFGGML